MENKRLNDIINVGIGAVQTSREIFDKLVDELNEGKEKIEARFDQLKTQGEKDMSDNALKLKVNLAWGLVRFEEIRDNILNHFIKNRFLLNFFVLWILRKYVPIKFAFLRAFFLSFSGRRNFLNKVLHIQILNLSQNLDKYHRVLL
ncbi:Uncharacterized protein AMR50_1533 [Leptospira interrogans]|nr:Uncharacterized protein AMR50_1533 [Leptospira interrogans]